MTKPSHCGSKGVTLTIMPQRAYVDFPTHMVSTLRGIRKYSIVRARAKEFGVHRDEQNAKSQDLFNELKKLVGLYRRTDEEERKHLSVDLPDILEWIENVAIPEYDAIDDNFRKNQKLWIRDIG